MLKDWKASKEAAEPIAPSSEPVQDSPIADDVPQLQSLKAKFSYASKRTGVPEEILGGVASRESHVGKSLDKAGFDPEKKAFGIMQVDGRYHKLRGTNSPYSQAHIDQAAEIIRDNKAIMDKRFPNWTEEQRWRAAAAGYNMGPGNVKTLDKMDEGTTGGDYSQDVMKRAKAYKLLKK